jgi:hypothetical protein
MPTMSNQTSQTASRGSGADEHSMGMRALSPLMLLCLIIVTGIAFWFFTQLQISATEQSVFGLLNLGYTVTPGETADQIQAFAAGSLDRNQTIADAIGWAVQITLMMISFSPDSALLMLHRKFNNGASASLARSAAGIAKLRKWMTVILIGGDILTDFVYVVQGHNLVVVHGLIPSLSSASAAGVILVGIMYPTAVCFVTVFVGKFLFVFIEALFEHLRQAAAAS